LVRGRGSYNRAPNCASRNTKPYNVIKDAVRSGNRTGFLVYDYTPYEFLGVQVMITA